MAEPHSLRVPTSWRRGAVGLGVLFIALELVTRAELVTPRYLPPASSIVGETARLFGSGDFWSAFWATMKASLIGLAVASLVAVPLGLVLGLSRWAYEAVMTVVELLRPLPSVALIPLAILVFGRGLEMKVWLVAYACLWPILFNAIYGMRNSDPIAAETARVLGVGRIKTLTSVHLRSAAPFIFTGIRIAAAVALILAVSTEIIAGGSDGLGIELSSARETGDLQLSYAYTIMTGVIGLALHLGFGVFERRWFSWQEAN